MDSENKTVLTSSKEERELNRKLLVWLNTYPELPVPVIRYEELGADAAGMALSVTQSAYITKRYIFGGYRAELNFKLLYRVKPGSSIDKRLAADEMLDAIGDWARNNKPELTGVNVRGVTITARSALYVTYENGDEDHQILLKLTYEVI